MLMNYLGHVLVTAIALLGAGALTPGMRIDNFWTAILAAVILGVLNVLVKPLLFFLTLPVNILTLGLFTFVVNGLVLWLTAAFLNGFEITNIFSAILGAIMVSIVSMIVIAVLPTGRS